MTIKNIFDRHIKFKGTEFIGYSKPEHENDYNLIWFSCLETIDMIFDW
jgi:hypothetical protein